MRITQKQKRKRNEDRKRIRLTKLFRERRNVEGIVQVKTDKKEALRLK